MCMEPATALAAASLVLGAASAVGGAASQQAEMDRQYSKALVDKRNADTASMMRLQSDRDALNQKSQLTRENAMREDMTVQRRNIEDVGKATAAAGASGASGESMSEVVTALYRQRDEAKDVGGINTDNAQANINSEIASRETTNAFNLASNIPSRGNSPSILAMGINIGTAAVGAADTYEKLGGTDLWASQKSKTGKS